NRECNSPSGARKLRASQDGELEQLSWGFLLAAEPPAREPAFCPPRGYLPGLRRLWQTLRMTSSPHSVKRLIVNGDDFGLSPQVNAGILYAHRQGILTDTSLMVTAPAWEDAVALAKATPSLGVGLHLTLVQGRAALAPHLLPVVTDPFGNFSR